MSHLKTRSKSIYVLKNHVATRAGNETSFEHFELGLLIYERARARAELLNELKIRLKFGLI